MSVLSDEQYRQMARDAGLDLEPTRNMLVEVRGQHAQLINFARAVAEAAIAADRAARAEPVGSLLVFSYPVSSTHDRQNYAFTRTDGVNMEDGRYEMYAAPPVAPVVQEYMSPANVPMYWRDESSNACAYAAGFNACRSAMLAAAPAPSQEPTT